MRSLTASARQNRIRRSLELASASGSAGDKEAPGWRRAFDSEPRCGDQAVISESNGSSLSVTLALASTNSVTLFSTTMASTSAMRERSDRYQRCTSTGFS